MEPRSVRKEERNYGENYRLAKNRSLIRHAELEPSIRGEDMEYVYGHQAKKLKRELTEERQRERERYYPKATTEEELEKEKEREELEKEKYRKHTIEEAIIGAEEEKSYAEPTGYPVDLSESPFYPGEEEEEETFSFVEEEKDEKRLVKELKLIKDIDDSIEDLSFMTGEGSEIEAEIVDFYKDKLKRLNAALRLRSAQKQGPAFISLLHKEIKETEDFLKGE